MILDRLRELGFVKESRAVKLFNSSDGPIGDRYDRVTYLREPLPKFVLETDRPVYVEASRFIPLISFIKKATALENYLEVVLKNGAEYKLPYLDVTFDFDVPMPTTAPKIDGKMDFTALKKTALQNLVKPEMRCVYVSQNGAVSCNFLQGTVDKNIKILHGEPLLLSPDIINYLPNDAEGKIYVQDDYIFYVGDFNDMIIAPKTELSEEEDPWYEVIYTKAEGATGEYMPIPADLEEGLKRLQCFGNDVIFEQDRVVSDSNFEPIRIAGAHGGEYEIEEVLSVLSGGKEILFKETEMYLKNGNITIMVSEKSDE